MDAIELLSERVRKQETKERMIVDTVAAPGVLTNHAPGIAGRLAFATDGRKYILGVYEGIGLGTGVLCYDDATSWISVDSGAAVLV